MLKNIIKSLIGTALVLSSVSSYALGTLSGSTISNTATVGYSVGGVAQTAIPSNSVSFVVDNKINVTVTPQATYTTSVPGSTAQVTSFVVTNTGNNPQDFALTANNALANGTVLYTKTDNFNPTSCQVFADANGDGVYQSATDTKTYVDELSPDISRTAFVVCDIPTTVVNNDFSAVSLTAQAATAGVANTLGAISTQSAGAKVLGTVSTVFADAAGTDDLAKDGKISGRSGYLISTATLTVTKSVVSYCDPLNFNTNPKLIPGAYARYTINVSNAAGTASATLTSVTDTLVAQLAFDPNLIQAQAASCSVPESAAGSGLKISCTGGSRACATTPIYVPTATVVTGQNINANLGTLLPAEGAYSAGELKAGESVNVIFNALIN